ncbi:MAG: hypothetical protein K8S94_04025 [Planctomycetia bacterium]|nr:hypothetical protein [Planctomycetia bacterium]
MLGLRADEADPLAIVRAADARLATLRAIDPGPFEKAHNAIVARVAQARDELLQNLTVAAERPRRAAPAGFAPPPPPRSHVGQTAPPASPVPPPVPVSPQPFPGFGTAADHDHARSESAVLRSVVPKQKSGSGGVFAALSIIVAVSVAAGTYAFWNELVGKPPRKAATRPPSTTPTTPAESPPKRTVSTEDERQLQRDRDEAARREAALAEEARSRREKQEELQKQESRERERLAALQRKRDEDEEEAREAEARRLEADDLVKAQSAVDRGLGDAYAALRRHDEEAARRSLQEAVKAAGEHGDLVTRADRWTLLVDYAAQLEEFQQEAIASANEGREYKIGNRTIAIIEITPKTFSYKEAGQTRRGSRASLPRPIERAILAQWFDGGKRAANHIFLGVHHLLDDEPDLDKVRAQWEIALAGEPATKSIMPLLDDPILTGLR